jgi:hypothetical protein
MLVFATTSIKKVQVFPKMPLLAKCWFNSSQIKDLGWLAKSAHNIPNLTFLILLDNKV